MMPSSTRRPLLLSSFRRLLALLLLSVAGLSPSLWGQVADPDVLEFAIITDTHQFGSTADVRMADNNVRAFVDYCNRTPSLQFALFGGDFYNAYDTRHDEGLMYLQQASQSFSGLRIPFYTTRGNHDCNGKCRLPDRSHDNSQIITDREYHELFNPLSTSSSFYRPDGIVADPENPYGNYYYRDFEQQRVRLIVLNNYDRDSLELAGYHGQQMRWLAEQALDFRSKADPCSWSFLILGHAVTIDHLHNPITRLLHAYVRGQDFFDTDAGVTYGCRYSSYPLASFIGFIYGHYHEDIYNNWDGYNLISINRGYATGSEIGYSELCFDHFTINTRTRTIHEQRIGHGQSRTYSYDPPQQLLPGRAFPEAEGMGLYTVGGRFGRIVHVTNLLDDGPGSLRDAIDQTGARTIVFDVAGTIQLESPLVILNDSITIAGQSSPAPGITLAGAPLVVNATQVIVRYLNVEQLRDADFRRYHLVLDHITAHSDTATALSIRRACNVSVQYCHISTNSQFHPALVAGGVRATYAYNHVTSSAMAVKLGDAEGENRWVQLGRNLISGWRHRAIYGGGHQGEFSLHENYFLPDSMTRHLQVLDVADDGTARYWLKRNQIEGQEQLTANGIALINDRPGVIYDPLPSDTLMRPLMDQVALPHYIAPAPSCLTISSFPCSYMFDEPSFPDLCHKILRQAGNHYRPETVCVDSLADSLATPQVLAYLDRIVRPERSIVVLYENDAHCRIDGYPYFAGLREPIASDSAHVALVSLGDALQGGLAGSITHGQAIVDILRHIPYEAMTLGTHDFDFTRQHIRQLFRGDHFPILCANLRHVQTDTLSFPAYSIRQYGRRRVAFIGVTTPSTQITNALSLADSTGVLHHDFDPEHTYQRVQHAVDQARQEGADYVIVLSQLGYNSDRFGISAPGLIAATTGIDAVLDGHSHMTIPNAVFCNARKQPVHYSQAGFNFSHIGKLVIDPDGRICSELIPTQQMKFRDPAVTQVVDSIKTLFMGSADDYAGRTLMALSKPKEYNPNNPYEINAGNLVTDAMRWSANADMAWLNAGSLRQSLPAGELTRGDIYELVPYDNELVLLTIPGRELHEAIRRLCGNLPIEGGVASPISGCHVVLQKGRRRNRCQLYEVSIYDRSKSRYMPIDPNRNYTVVTTDYCTSIGWSSKIFTHLYNQQTLGMNYNEAVFQYINQQLNGLVDPTPELYEQRVVIK